MIFLIFGLRALLNKIGPKWKNYLSIGNSAAEFRKYCKRLHVDMYTNRKRLHAKNSIVHIVYNVWCLMAMGKKNNER